LGSSNITTKDGKTLTKHQILTEDDQVMDTFAKVEEGQSYEGDITENAYGKLFKKSQQGFSAGMRNDPNTRKEIIRQNSLTNAVNYVTAKANLMSKEKGLEFMTGKEVLQVATYFARYSEGAVTVVNEPEQPKMEETEPVIATLPRKELGSTIPDVPMPTETVTANDDINLDDIPF
jgi:hypothetical protein